MIKKVVVVITVFMLVFSFPLIQVFGATPFVDTSIRVSDAIKNLPGYGLKINDSIYNYIDFESKHFIQCVKQIYIVNVYEVPYTYSNVKYYSIPKPLDFIGYNSVSNNFLVPNFNNFVSDWDNASHIGEVTGYADYYNIWFGFPIGTTLDEAKASLIGLPFVYELSTPITTDISDLLPNDEYIYGTSGVIGNYEKVQAFEVNTLYEGDKIFKNINVNLDNARTFYTYKLDGVEKSSMQIGNSLTVDIDTSTSNSITSYYQTSYLFGYGDNDLPLFFDFGALTTSIVANFKVKYNMMYYFDSSVEGDYMSYAIYFKDKNGTTIGAHVEDYDFQNNGDYSIDDEFSVVVPSGTVCFNVIYRTNLVNQSSASPGYSDFFYNMSFEEFSFTIEDSVYDQLYNDPETEVEANDFDKQMNSTINKGHQVQQEIESLNKPKPNEIASQVDPLSQVDSTIYNNYMTLFTPILNSKFVLPMLLISFSVALVGYVLFGKRG